MSDLFAQMGWTAVLIAVVPSVLITVCVVVIALAALGARRPATRRHCLALIAHLTRYASVVRSRRRASEHR